MDNSLHLQKRIREIKNLEKHQKKTNDYIFENSSSDLNLITHIKKKHRGSGGKFLKVKYTAPKIWRPFTEEIISSAVNNTQYNQLIIDSILNGNTQETVEASNINTSITPPASSSEFIINTSIDTINYDSLDESTKDDITKNLTDYLINIMRFNPGSFIIILSRGSLKIQIKLVVTGNITSIKLKNESHIFLNQHDRYIEYGTEVIIDGIINTSGKYLYITYLLNDTPISYIDTSIAETYTIKYDIVIKNQILDTVNRIVIVVDNIPPVITLLGESMMTINQNIYFGDIDMGINITDNGGDGNIDLRVITRVIKNENQDTVDYATFTEIRGTYYISYFVEDICGNVATNTRTVNVVDNISPVIVFNQPSNFDLYQNDLYISNDPGIESVLDIGGDLSITTGNVIITVTNSDDIQVEINNFTEIVGIYKLTYSIVDDVGNIGTAIREINVIDNIAPIILLIGSSNYTINQGENFNDPGVTITDTGGDSDISTSNINIEIKDPLNNTLNYSYPLNHALQAITAGIYTITYKATDNANNETRVIRTINVQDRTNPIINLNYSLITSNTPISLNQGEDFTTGDPGILNVTDIGGDPNISTRTITKTVVDSNNISQSISSFTQISGRYIVTYSVTDTANNVGLAYRTVDIIDNIPPVITLNGDLNPQIRRYETFTDPGISDVTDTGGDGSISVSFVTKNLIEVTNYLVKVDTKSSNHIDYGNGSLSCYVLNDIETPTLTFSIGETYRFIQEDTTNSGHPIKFYLDKQKNTLYETNVTYNLSPGSTGSYTEIQVDSNTPNIIYYQCGSHSLMGGKILVKDESFELSNFFNRLGLYELIYSVNDSKLNEGTISRNIYIYDNTSPNISLSGGSLTLMQGDILIDHDPGIDKIIDTHGDINGDLIIDHAAVILEITNSLNQVITYDAVTLTGDTYTFTYTITDEAGNIGSAIRSVTVLNNTPPIITLTEPTNMTINQYSSYIDPGITSIIDDVDGTMSINSYTKDIIEVKNYTVILQTPSSSVFLINGLEAPILTFKIGETYKFIQEHSSNSGHPVKFYLDEAKAQEYNGGVTIVSSPGTIGSYSQIQVGLSTPSIIYYQCENHNNMGGKIIVNNTTFNLTDFVTRLGQYSISYTATDIANNEGTVYRTVKIIKNDNLLSTDPEITLTGSTEFTLNLGDTFNDPGIRSIQSNGTDTISSYDISPTVTDSENNAIDISTFTQTPGTYTLTYTVSDSGGNTQSTSRTITIYQAIATPAPEEPVDWSNHQYFGFAPTDQRGGSGTFIIYDFEIVQDGVDLIEYSPNLGSTSIPGVIEQSSPAAAGNTWVGFYYGQSYHNYQDWWADHEEPLLYYKTNDATPASGNITVRMSWHSTHMSDHGHFLSSDSPNGPWVIRASWDLTNLPTRANEEYVEWHLFDSPPPPPITITKVDTYIPPTGRDDRMAQPDAVSVSRDGTRVAVGSWAYGTNPPNSDGVTYDQRGIVNVFEWNGSSWTKIGNSIIGEDPFEKLGHAVAMNSNGTRLILGGLGLKQDPNGASQVYETGWAQAYELTGNTWVKMGQFINGILKYDEFSSSVDINDDGTIIAIGAKKHRSSGDAPLRMGQIRIFKYNSTTKLWFQLGQDIDGDNNDTETGTALALNHDGTWLASGEPLGDRSDSNSWSSARGQVRVFQLDPTVSPDNWETHNPQWIQRGSKFTFDPETGAGGTYRALVGSSVSLSNHNGAGLRLAYGSPKFWPETDGSKLHCGAVYVYEWNGSSWAQVGSKITGDYEENQIGKRVSITKDGNRIATLSGKFQYGTTSTGGYMYIYDWDGTQWVNQIDTGYNYTLSLNVLTYMYSHSLSMSANGKVVMVGESEYYAERFANTGIPVDGRVARYDIDIGIYEPPIITLLGETEIELEENAVFVDPGTTVSYLSGNPATITPTIVDANYNTQVLSSFTETPGVYNLTYTAFDSDGNRGYVSRKVTVTAIAKSVEVTLLNSLDGSTANDNFGRNLKVNGDGTIMAATHGTRDSPRTIKVYSWSDGSSTWVNDRGTININISVTDRHGNTFLAWITNFEISSTGLRIGILISAGKFAMYEWDGSNWNIMTGYSGKNTYDYGVGSEGYQGLSLNHDGSRIMLGLPSHNIPYGLGWGDQGGIRIFEWINSEWLERGCEHSGENTTNSNGRGENYYEEFYCLVGSTQPPIALYQTGIPYGCGKYISMNQSGTRIAISSDKKESRVQLSSSTYTDYDQNIGIFEWYPDQSIPRKRSTTDTASVNPLTGGMGGSGGGGTWIKMDVQTDISGKLVTFNDAGDRMAVMQSGPVIYGASPGYLVINDTMGSSIINIYEWDINEGSNGKWIKLANSIEGDNPNEYLGSRMIKFNDDKLIVLSGLSSSIDIYKLNNITSRNTGNYFSSMERRWERVGSRIDSLTNLVHPENYISSVAMVGSRLIVGMSYHPNASNVQTGRVNTYSLVEPDEYLDASNAPIITLNVGNTIEINAGNAYIEYGITVTHNRAIINKIENPLPKNDKNKIQNIDDFFNYAGTYTFTYTATDDAGITSCMDRIVIVKDIIPPTIILNGGDVYLLTGDTYIEHGVDSIYDVSGDGLLTKYEIIRDEIVYLSISPSDVTISIRTENNNELVDSISTAQPNIYNITYSISDSAGNIGTAIRKITITDTKLSNQRYTPEMNWTKYINGVMGVYGSYYHSSDPDTRIGTISNNVGSGGRYGFRTIGSYKVGAVFSQPYNQTHQIEYIDLIFEFPSYDTWCSGYRQHKGTEDSSRAIKKLEIYTANQIIGPWKLVARDTHSKWHHDLMSDQITDWSQPTDDPSRYGAVGSTTTEWNPYEPSKFIKVRVLTTHTYLDYYESVIANFQEFKFTSIDTVAPVINIIGSDISLIYGVSFIDPGVESVSDIIDITLTVSDVIITTTPTNIADVGTYTITYSLTDNTGNVGISTRTVNIIEAEVQPFDTGVTGIVFTDGTKYIVPSTDTTFSNDIMAIAYSVTEKTQNEVYRIQIGDAITHIGPLQIDGLHTMTLEYRTLSSPVTLTSQALQGSNGLTDIKLQDDTRLGGGRCFSECINLLTLTLPASLTTTTWYLFASSTSLTSVILPAGCGIDGGTFNGCSNLTTIVIGNTTYTAPYQPPITAGQPTWDPYPPYLNTPFTETYNDANPKSVLDTVNPTIILNGGSMSIYHGDNFTDPGVASVSDNIDTNLTVSDVVITSPANIANIGTHNISYYLQDSAGNETTVYREVVVLSVPTRTWYWPNDTNLVSYIMDYHTNYNNGTSPIGGMAGAEDTYYMYYNLEHGACTENPSRFSNAVGPLPMHIRWKNANSPYTIDPATNGYPEFVFTFNSSDTWCSGFRQKSNADPNGQAIFLKDFEVYYNTTNNLSSGWQQIGGTYTHALQKVSWNTTVWTPVRCKLLKIRLKMSYWGWDGRSPKEYDCNVAELNLEIGV